VADESAHQISAEGLAALDAELHELETEGRRAIAERIHTAREWGDLKENAEYHDAKEAQAHLETKWRRRKAWRSGCSTADADDDAGSAGATQLACRGRASPGAEVRHATRAVVHADDDPVEGARPRTALCWSSRSPCRAARPRSA